MENKDEVKVLVSIHDEKERTIIRVTNKDMAYGQLQLSRSTPIETINGVKKFIEEVYKMGHSDGVKLSSKKITEKIPTPKKK